MSKFVTITAQRDGTITRACARELRALGLDVTGSTEDFRAADLVRAAGHRVRVVSATTGEVYGSPAGARVARDGHRYEVTGYVRAQIRARKTAREDALFVL